MATFLVAPGWYPLDEFWDCVKEVPAESAKIAAQIYVETNLANLDYPTNVEIRTAPGRSQKTTLWDVVIESIPQAIATPIEPHDRIKRKLP